MKRQKLPKIYRLMQEGSDYRGVFYVEKKTKFLFWEYWAEVNHDGSRYEFKTKELAQKFIVEGCTYESAYPNRASRIVEEIVINPMESNKSRYDLLED